MKEVQVGLMLGELYGQFLTMANDEQRQSLLEQIMYYKESYLKHAEVYGNIAALLKFIELIEKLQDDALNEIDRKTISCKKGCSDCCYIHIDITEHEAELILDYCKDKEISIDWDRLEKQASKTLHNYGKLSKANRRCIFLSDENGCSIYPYRPINCRLYLTTDDASKCGYYGKSIEAFFAYQPETVAVAVYNAVGGDSLAKIMLKMKNKSI